MPRKCVNHPDNSCYVCGNLTFKDQRRSLIPLVKKCYELYFGCKVGDQGKNWALRLVRQVGHLPRIIPSSINKLMNLGKKYSKACLK